MTQTDRQLSIVYELQQHGWQRAADLAETFGVSTRTIYRDIDMLVTAGIPVVAVPGKGYRLNEGYFLPALTLTTDEAVLLLLGSKALAGQLDVNYQAAARSVRKKIEALLPDRLRSEAATLQTSLRFVPVNAFDDPAEQAALQALREALSGRRAVRFREPGGSGRDSIFHPYGLIDFAGAWHMVGYDRQRQRVRHVRLSRMEGLVVLDETFERPKGYTQHASPEPAPRDLVVRVRFSPDVAAWVQEASSHYTVEMEAQADGLYVTLKVRRETEVLPWLLSWGSHAQVLEPPSLQRRLAREAERMAAHYQTEPLLLP